MEKKGVELLEKAPPSKVEKATATVAKTVGIPFVVGIQIIFLTLLAFSFKLNQDLTAFSTTVAETEETLAQMEELETLFLVTQGKLEAIATVKEAFCYPCALKTFEKITPPPVSITTASFEQTKLSFTAETSHGPSFALFVANLLEEKAVKEAALTSGRLSQEGYFTFTMEFVFEGEGSDHD